MMKEIGYITETVYAELLVQPRDRHPTKLQTPEDNRRKATKKRKEKKKY